MTKIDDINHHFENYRAYNYIFRALVEEKSSGIPLTIERLDAGTRQWLDHKGFQTNEEIEELAKLVGSLAQGLIVLVCSLPKRGHGEVSHVRPQRKTISKEHKYPKELLTAVRKLRQEKVQKNFIGIST